MASSILALDLGSSSIKALVADGTGRPGTAAVAKAPIRTPRGVGGLAREFRAEQLWGTIVHVARQAIEDSSVASRDIAAIGVTSQRQGIALLDKAGRELYVGPNTDLRALFEGAEQDEAHRELFYRTTGHLPPFFMAPAKLQWFKLHRPRLYERVATVLTLADWAVFRLTGERAGERALAGEAGLVAVTKGRWAQQLMRTLGLRDDWFPPLVATGAVIGHLSSGAAGALGLRPKTLVVAAGPDTQCGLLGMGVSSAGQVGVVAGWSMAVQRVTSAPRLDMQHHTWLGLHPLLERWVLEANLGDAGASYQWVARTLYGTRPAAYAMMERAAAKVPPGAEGATAFVGPSFLDMSNPGMRMGGVLFPLPLGQAAVRPASIARAALEGTAFAVREALEHLQAVDGRAAVDVAMGGGMLRTGPLPQLVADVCGRELRLATVSNVSAYGAVLAAAAGIGVFVGLEEAAAQGGLETLPVRQSPEAALQYNDLYHRWRRLRAEVERLPLDG